MLKYKEIGSAFWKELHKAVGNQSNIKFETKITQVNSSEFGDGVFDISLTIREFNHPLLHGLNPWVYEVKYDIENLSAVCTDFEIKATMKNEDDYRFYPVVRKAVKKLILWMYEETDRLMSEEEKERGKDVRK